MPGCRLFVSFGTGMGEGVGNHPVVAPLVDTNLLAATTVDLVASGFSLVPLGDSGLVTTDNMAMTYFIISP